LSGLEDLEFMPRGQHIADALRQCLPDAYGRAVQILLDSFTPPQTEADEFGLAEFFYLPHSFFIASYGIHPEYNGGSDPFDISMNALHALTMRFTSEFAIRPFLIQQQDRTLSQVMKWTNDPNPHVRRLCSEGTRPKLPWGKRIPAFIKNPAPTLPILELLKDDPSLYVRRSVANHLGDIAKDHPQLVIEICRRWLEENASDNSKWLIRHAIRNLVKEQNSAALALRNAAT
ncbi:MAG: DNA alkylation repair protein, partial [Rhodospirillaceae bacterium]